MSILIKGMEMPTSCYKCELMTANYGCVIVGAVGGESYRKRALDCPLVEIPTPHGRLIDADALIKEFGDVLGKIAAENLNDMWIGEQPTVIESETGEP